MVDQLNAFSGEVTRWRARWSPRAKLGGQRGCWACWNLKDVTEPNRERVARTSRQVRTSPR